uniref:G domain-containing protein n=1 Tax=Panagrolaimus sp. ES5 TaxID=591445 RepID=A0AC34GN03_9BILA
MQNFHPRNRAAGPNARIRQQKNFNLDSVENCKKQIVIFNLTEPVGIANPELIDSQIVHQILMSIVGTSLNTKVIKRLGKYTPDKPRRIVVQFYNDKDQKLAVESASKLNNFQFWKHLDIQPYRPHKDKNINEKKQNRKDSTKATENLNLQSLDDAIPDLSNPFAKFAAEESCSAKNEINILVIGETGVGKSTWINGIANYMSFNSFDDALAAKKPICLISMNFSLFVGKTNKEINVKMKPTIGEKNQNEAEASTGQSCTQEPKVYRYITDTVAFNLIDTPGIGDTRGIEYDMENMKMIIECMSQWKEIHGICLLLKPDQHRLVKSFRYSIEELLINLHKNSIPNIAVIFTNSAKNFYRPGETLTVLKNLFEGIKGVTGSFIPLEDKNTFCIDNEAVRRLYAKYNGIKFDKNSIDNAPYICCGQNCFETVKALNSVTPDKFFKHACCKQCPLKGITPDHVGHINLRECEAFKSDGNCKTCGCSWQLHMHFWYSQKKVFGNFSSSTNQESINILHKQIIDKAIYIEQLQKTLKLLEKYNQEVIELCGPFYEFLTENSSEAQSFIYGQSGGGSSSEAQSFAYGQSGGGSSVTSGFGTQNNEDQIKKKVVIWNLEEPLGNEEDRKNSDRNTVKQILISIGAASSIVESLDRHGKPQSTPRRIVVEFATENQQQNVLTNAKINLKNFPKWRGVSITPYRAPHQRKGYKPTQSMQVDPKIEQMTEAMAEMQRFLIK